MPEPRVPASASRRRLIAAQGMARLSVGLPPFTRSFCTAPAWFGVDMASRPEETAGANCSVDGVKRTHVMSGRFDRSP